MASALKDQRLLVFGIVCLILMTSADATDGKTDKKIQANDQQLQLTDAEKLYALGLNELYRMQEDGYPARYPFNYAGDSSEYEPVMQKRSCLRRGASCDARPNDCCESSACRCNLWGTNCRCHRAGLLQRLG